MSNILHFFFKYLIIPFTLLAYVLNIYYNSQYPILQYSYNILLTGSIGFYTNFIAIKLLFHPKEKTILFRLHGLLPKEKENIAANIGEGVEEEFFNTEMLEQHILENGLDKKIIESIFSEFENKTDNAELIKIKDSIKNKSLNIRFNTQLKLKNISLNKNEINSIKEYLEKEEVILNYIKKILPNIKQLKIGELISSKIKGYDSEIFEKKAIEVSKNHLKFIEISGGILGIFAGIAIFNIQIFLLTLLIISSLFGLDLLLTKRCKSIK